MPKQGRNQNNLSFGMSQVYCKTVGDGGVPNEPHCFKVAYDKLVIAAGAEPLTFGIKGVKENAYFLREVNHAQEIRKKLLLNLMLSENPGKFFSKARGPWQAFTLPGRFEPIFVLQEYLKKKRSGFCIVW